METKMKTLIGIFMVLCFLIPVTANASIFWADPCEDLRQDYSTLAQKYVEMGVKLDLAEETIDGKDTYIKALDARLDVEKDKRMDATAIAGATGIFLGAGGGEVLGSVMAGTFQTGLAFLGSPIPIVALLLIIFN